MKNLELIANEETIDWLLEKENPSVRYFTLTRLMNKSRNDKEVILAKDEIMNRGIVPKILLKQDESGFWISPERYYTAKYSGTVWQLILLAELGADKENLQIRKACEFILNKSQDTESSGFSPRSHAKIGGGLHNDVIPCLTGNMIWSLIMLGFIDDERVKGGIDWICKYQRCDDGIDKAPEGWPYDRYQICWGRHSCHMGVIKSLKALSAIPKEKRSKQVEEKIKSLVEYFLEHHIYKKSHDLGKVSKPGWLKLGFPLMYQTDILEILGLICSLGYTDSRMSEAIGILEGKQTREKRWNLENTFNGRMGVNIEEKGKPSKWITYKAISILMQS